MKEIKIVLGKLLEDWADGKVDNPDKALAEIKKIFSILILELDLVMHLVLTLKILLHFHGMCSE